MLVTSHLTAHRIATLLGAVLLASCSCQRTSPTSIASEEQVWIALLHTFDRQKNSFLFPETLVLSAARKAEFGANSRKMAGDLGADQSAVENLVSALAAASDRPRIFPRGVTSQSNVRFLDAADTSKAKAGALTTCDNCQWAAAIEDGSNGQIFWLSRVAFAGDLALVYFEKLCGSECGEGAVVLLRYSDGRWVLQSKSAFWVS